MDSFQSSFHYSHIHSRFHMTVPEQPGDMLMLNHSGIPLLVLQVPVS